MSFVFGDFGATREGPPLGPAEVFRRFYAAAVMVWGERTLGLLDVSLNTDPANAALLSRRGILAAILRPTKPKPYAAGRHLIRGAPWYRLCVSPEALMLTDEDLEKILIHEAVHLGHNGHGAEFKEVTRECGGVVSGSQLEEDAKIACENKLPGTSRYVTVKEFELDDEAAATAWIKAEMRSGNYPVGTRWRMSQ